MADLPISQLPLADAITGAEIVAVVQDSTTKRSTLGNIVEAVTLNRDRIINTESDFPVAVGGVITLEDNVVYKIGGQIVTANRFQLGVGTKITAGTALVASLIYTGTGSMFTGQQIDISDIVISCPSAQVFNLTGTGSGDYLLTNTILVAQATKWGTVNDINDVNIINSGTIDIQDGLTVQGVTNWNTFRIDGLNFQSSSATYVGLDITGSLLNDVKIDAFVQTAPVGAIGLKADANSVNIESGDIASYTNGGFRGGITPLDGVTIADTRYNFQFNSGIANSTINANPYMTAPITVTQVAANDWKKVNQGVWSFTESERLTVTADGDIINSLEVPIKIQISGFITLEAVSGTDNIGARLVYNGLFNDAVSVVTQNETENRQATSIPLFGIFTLQPSDNVAIYIANLDSNTSINVTKGKFTTLRVL